MSKRGHILQIIPVLVAVAAGSCAIWLTGLRNADFVDTADYLVFARGIFENGVYPDHAFIPIMRPPLFPLLLAGTWLVSPGSVIPLKVLQVLLLAFSTMFIYRAARMLTGNDLAGFAAAMLLAVNPFMVFVSAAVQSEMLQVFLMSLAVYLVARIVVERASSMYVAGTLGIVLGLGTLNKPATFGIGLAMATTLAVLRWGQGGIGVSSVMVACMVLALVPWALYNRHSRGELMFTTDGGGYNLWIGNLPETLEWYSRDFNSAAEQGIASDELRIRNENKMIEGWEANGGFWSRTPAERDRLWRDAAIENMKQHPGDTTKLFGWKLYNFWKPYLNANVHSGLYSAASAMFLIALWVLSLGGMIRLWQTSNGQAMVLAFLAVAVAATAIHVVLVASMRHRVPFTDPFFALFGGIGAVWAATKMLPGAFGPERSAFATGAAAGA